MHYGSLAWARATKGHLTGMERLHQLWVAAVFQLRSRRRPPPGLDAKELDSALEETTLPDTPAVAASFAHVSSLGPPALVGHVVRTYVWGTLLGVRDGLRWDRELFAVASLLHDVALARRRHEFTCFAHDGAEQAFTMLEKDLPAEKRAVVSDAICLHLRVEVPTSLGIEAHLVHAGAGLDVLGQRARELSPKVRADVLAKHPRLDLVDVLSRVLGEEATRHPTSRAGRWVKSGFLQFVRANPLERR